MQAFRFLTMTGEVQRTPTEREWNNCILAARCIVVETLKAVQFTNGTEEDMSILDLPQVIGILTDKMLGYMAALVFRVRSSMDSYKSMDRLIVYQRAYDHLILICRSNPEARVQIVEGQDFYAADVVQLWTRAFAEMLETCPASCVSFLCDFVLRNEQGALRDFSAVCLSALLVKHRHWYANDILSGRFTSCYERRELTRDDLAQMSLRMAEMTANPPPTPETDSPPEPVDSSTEQQPDKVAEPQVAQETAEPAAPSAHVHAPHVDTVLALCASRGCPCVQACVNGSEETPSDATALIRSLHPASGSAERRREFEATIAQALSSPVAKVLPFDVLKLAFPVSFLDELAWAAIKSVSVTGTAALFTPRESECLLVQGKCANWMTLVRALGVKE